MIKNRLIGPRLAFYSLGGLSIKFICRWTIAAFIYQAGVVDIEYLKQWIGKEETFSDLADVATLERLAALLDQEQSPRANQQVPPLGHWLYFLPHARQSEIDVDGHPRRGGLLPPVPLPRRMWAGGRLEFRAPIPAGAPITRCSKVLDVKFKKGASGDLVFLLVQHEIKLDGQTAILEEQDIVYRSAAVSGERKPTRANHVKSLRQPEKSRRIIPDPTQLFRYSALTFNAHRIHYDRDYARDEEGYAGLVIQGPYIATLLLDHFIQTNPKARVRRFSFRALKPLLDQQPFELCLAHDGGARTDLWTVDAAGDQTMVANVEID